MDIGEESLDGVAKEEVGVLRGEARQDGVGINDAWISVMVLQLAEGCLVLLKES